MPDWAQEVNHGKDLEAGETLALARGGQDLGTWGKLEAARGRAQGAPQGLPSLAPVGGASLGKPTGWTYIAPCRCVE